MRCLHEQLRQILILVKQEVDKRLQIPIWEKVSILVGGGGAPLEKRNKCQQVSQLRLGNCYETSPRRLYRFVAMIK